MLNRIYAAKCTNCLQSINSDELVMRVHGFIYHLSCFICLWCKRQLKKGDKFALRGHQPICEKDLTKSDHYNHQEQLSLLNRTILNNNNDNIIGYDLINGLSVHSPTTMSNDGGNNKQSSHLTMLQPLSNNNLSSSSCQHDNQSDHQYSPRALTICDSPMIIKNDQPPPPPSSSSSSSSNSQQSYHQSPSHNSNSLMMVNNNHNKNNNSTSPIPIKQDGRRGPKRPRTILTTAQRRAFKASFEISQKPCRKVRNLKFCFSKKILIDLNNLKKVRETLAKETGLSVRIVQVWFQNQRAKVSKKCIYYS